MRSMPDEREVIEAVKSGEPAMVVVNIQPAKEPVPPPLIDTGGSGHWKCPKCGKVHERSFMSPAVVGIGGCWQCSCGYHYDSHYDQPEPSGKYEPLVTFDVPRPL